MTAGGEASARGRPTPISRRTGRCSRTGRRCSSSTCRPPTPMATPSSSSAAPTSSARAPCSTPRRIRASTRRRRQHRRDHRSAEPRDRHCHSGREPGRWHGDRARARTAQRRNRRRQLSRHGHDRARPGSRDGEEGQTLEQVKRARPTADYDGLYGHPRRGRPTSSSKRCFAASAGGAMTSAPRLGMRCSGRRRRSPRWRSPWPAPAGGQQSAAACRHAARRRVPRSHRAMGVGRHGRLAMADGDAAERRHGQRSAEPGRAQGGRRVGSGRRPHARRSVQGVRSSVVDPPAGTAANPVGGRQHAAARVRRRHAGATASLRPAAPAARDRCRGSRRRSGSGSRRIAASSAAAAAPPAARSRS